MNSTCSGFMSSKVTKTDAALHENDTSASVSPPITVVSQRMQSTSKLFAWALNT